MKKVRIGSGSGFSGDRIEPAVELAEKGDIQYLVFECLAERTIALAQLSKLRDPSNGYDPLLVERMSAVLKLCVERRIRIVTNMGAANPIAGAMKVRETADRLGIHNLTIAAVLGDDVLDVLKEGSYSIEETGGPVAEISDRLISANAYLGAAPIVEALAHGADVVVTGRVADPALFMAPLIHEFGWPMDDWDLMGKGTVVGHLLECAGQVTGGYFADPGPKDVAGLAKLGFPIAEVTENGDVVITKVPGSGGAVTTATCKEQILYEIHDPAHYLTPDVVADFSRARVEQVGPDRAAITGATGHPKPDSLKVSAGYSDGFIGEGQISYAGPNALARARLARDIVDERLNATGVAIGELRFDFIGHNAVYGRNIGENRPQPTEVRLRVVGRTNSLREAERIGNEVEALYTSGPAGGGGAMRAARQVVAMLSVLIPRQLVTPTIRYFKVTT